MRPFAFMDAYNSRRVVVSGSPNPAEPDSVVTIRCEADPRLGPLVLTINGERHPVSPDQPRTQVRMGREALYLLAQAGGELREEIIELAVQDAPAMDRPKVEGGFQLGRQTKVQCTTQACEWPSSITATATQNGQLLAQASQRARRGAVDLLVTPLSDQHPIIISVVAETAHAALFPDRARAAAETAFPVTRVQPSVELTVTPPIAETGQSVVINWESVNAETAVLNIIDNGVVTSKPMPASGFLPYMPLVAGTVTVELTARGQNDGQARKTRNLTVRDPEFTFGGIAKARIGHGEPGEMVVFPWHVRGARDLWVVPDDGSGARPVRPSAVLSVELGWLRRDFQLVAIDYRGEHHVLLLQAVPNA